MTFAEFVAFAEKLDPAPRARALGLRRLYISPTLLAAFPLPRVGRVAREVYHELVLALAHDHGGKNRNLECVLADLARYGVAREEVLRRSDVPVAVYRRVVAVARALDFQRAPVMRLRRSYADLLRQLRRDRYMRPAVRRSAMRDVVLILRYLAQFPTEDQARRWRRRLGVDKGAQLDKLKVWTVTGKELASYLDRVFKNYERI